MATMQLSSQMLDMLEVRLKRISFLMTGDDADPTPATGSTSQPAAIRLRTMMRTLDSMAAKHPSISLILGVQRDYPDLFDPAAAPSIPALAATSLAQLNIAHESLYRNVSAQLQQLQSLSTPQTSESVVLVHQRERIEKASLRQDELLEELQELRGKSAQLLERWYENGVIGMGEKWADWEERLRDLEISVRRREAIKRKEDGTA